MKLSPSDPVPFPAPRRAGRALRALMGAALLALALPPGVARGEANIGTLVAVGGGSEIPELMQEVLELARGRASRVAIVNTASERPERSGVSYRRYFQEKLGVAATTVVPLLTREQAYDEAVLDQIGQADLIYVTGGNQIRLAQTLAGTPAHGAMLAAWQRGVVLAGTSAGAMVWGPSYITTGTSAAALQRNAGAGSVETREGLGLLPGLVIDTHFGREGRLGRLLVAATSSPRTLGIGVDEGTAAVLNPEGLRVLGTGRVTVLDLGRAKVSASKTGPFSIRNVEMHLLAAGEALRWQREQGERRPMLPQRADEPPATSSLWMQGGEPVPPAGWFRVSAGPFGAGGGVFSRLPDEVLILAGNAALDAAQRWHAAVSSAGRVTVRTIPAAQLRTPILQQYLTIAGGVILVEDAGGSLAAALAGEPAQLLRQHAGHLQLVSAGPAVGMMGEAATRAGTDLAPGLRVAPGLVMAPEVWGAGAFDRLVMDSLLAEGALGVGLAANNGVHLEGGALVARGEAPVLLVETRRVSLANPPLASARDLRLHVLAPGEQFRLSGATP